MSRRGRQEGRQESRKGLGEWERKGLREHRVK